MPFFRKCKCNGFKQRIQTLHRFGLCLFACGLQRYGKGTEEELQFGRRNVGTWITPYASLEAFFQQSAKTKAYKGTEYRVRTEFYAYGLDAYGYLPIGCDGFNLLGSLGLANYNMKAKYHYGNVDKQRMGYRAGIGAQFDFTENFAARVVGRYSYIGAKHLDNLMEVTAGIRYTF